MRFPELAVPATLDFLWLWQGPVRFADEDVSKGGLAYSTGSTSRNELWVRVIRAPHVRGVDTATVESVRISDLMVSMWHSSCRDRAARVIAQRLGWGDARSMPSAPTWRADGYPEWVLEGERTWRFSAPWTPIDEPKNLLGECAYNDALVLAQALIATKKATP